MELGDGKTQAITSELLLVATGRAPVTEGLGVEDLGLTMDRGYIKVDELYRTSVPHVSAIGDVITVGGRARTRNWRTCRRPRASWWPSGWPGKDVSRSTTITCPAAPTAIPRSAASG